MQRLFFALTLFAMPTFLLGQTSSPSATTSGTVESNSVDDDTPKEAAKRLWAAVAKEDFDDVRALLSASSAQEDELADALAQMLVAGQALSASAREKFGDDAAPFAGQMVDSRDPAVIDRAEVVMKSDDVATIAVEGSIRRMTFNRGVGNKWRLDVGAYLESRSDAPVDTPREDVLPRQIALLNKTAGILREAADQIRAGTHATVKDADEAIQRNLHEMMIESHRPATTQSVK